MVHPSGPASATHDRRFWQDTPPAAQCAFIAALILSVMGLGGFVGFTAMISVEMGVSPATVIFGPLPGNPMIVWLYYAVPCMLVQIAVAGALGNRLTALRIAGTAGAFGIAIICLLSLAAIAYELLGWLITGTINDVGDLLGELFLGVPLGLALGVLNARAVLLSVCELRTPKRERPFPGGDDDGRPDYSVA